MRMTLKSVMAGALMSLATVAVSGVAHAAVCGAPGFNNLANLAGSACTVGDKTFTFSTGDYSPTGAFAPGGTNPVPASSVGVGPALTFISSGIPGLLLTAGWTALGIQGDAFITFAVTGPPSSIVDAELSLSGATGAAADVEDISSGISPGGTFLGSITATATAPNPPSLSITPPQTSVFVSDNLTVPAGDRASDLDKQFSQSVPEPASLAILGISLLGMGAGAAFRRHRK